VAAGPLSGLATPEHDEQSMHESKICRGNRIELRIFSFSRAYTCLQPDAEWIERTVRLVGAILFERGK